MARVVKPKSVIRISLCRTTQRNPNDRFGVIEDAEFRLALAQAKANLANAMAGGSATSAGVSTSSSSVSVTTAGLEEARVQMENARREDERYAALLAKGAVTRQQYDNVHTARLATEARYEAMSHQREAANSVRNEQSHRLAQSQAAIEAAKAAVHTAELNLSYTVVLATADGMIGHKDIHEGQLVQPGQTLCSIVDASDMWVVANYRETQMPAIAVGCKVRMTAIACLALAANMIRMRNYPTPYIEWRIVRYRYLRPILLFVAVFELIMSVEHVLEMVYYEEVMHYTDLTYETLNQWSLIGAVAGCFFSLGWLKLMRWSQYLLIAIGMGFICCYCMGFYFLVSPATGYFQLVPPLICRGFGYAVLYLRGKSIAITL